MGKALALYQQVENRQESLVLAHMAMVKRVAVHLKARVPPFMELDELVQVGMIGLIEAARAYDPSKGFGFENFALSRVRGAILDEVRKLSFLPRSAVAFNKSENQATHVLAAELQRPPTQAEIAEYMGKDIEEFQKERGHAVRFETYSMELVNDEVMNLADEASQQPDAILEQSQILEAVTAGIEQLPEREKMIVSLYYVDELNLKEIGEVLGVTESRVSQILSGIVKKLRSHLQVA